MSADFHAIAGLTAIGFDLVGMRIGDDDDLVARRRLETDSAELIDHVDTGTGRDGVLEFLAGVGRDGGEGKQRDTTDGCRCVRKLHVLSLHPLRLCGPAFRQRPIFYCYCQSWVAISYNNCFC